MSLLSMEIPTQNGMQNNNDSNHLNTNESHHHHQEIPRSLFGSLPHPKFDSPNVLDKLRSEEVGQELLNTVYQNKSPRDHVVEEIMSEARRKLLEPRLIPDDIIEPVDKVYTIGCFDVFHPGHELLLKRMRAYGKKVCVGVHDSDSIHKLKGIWPEDSVAKRMLNVKEYADVVFCIAGTDPTPFIVSAIDLQEGETALYIRGNDMENFPSKDVVSLLMPIKLLPYSAGISSSQLRSTIHSLSDEMNDQSENFNSCEEAVDRSSCSIDTNTATSDETGAMDVFDFEV